MSMEAQLTESMQELLPEEPKLVIDRVPQPNPQLIEPKPEDVILCTYPDTLDGRLAAWVVRRVAQAHKIPVEFNTNQTTSAMPGQNWIAICDKDFPTSTEGKSLMIITHGFETYLQPAPLPFKQWKRTFPFGVETLQRIPGKAGSIVAAPRNEAPNSKSLSTLAWDFFYADRVGFDKRPRLIDYVNDAETEAFTFNDTKAVVACIWTYPHDFQTLDKLVEAADDRKRLPYIVNAGEAVLRYIKKSQIDEDAV